MKNNPEFAGNTFPIRVPLLVIKVLATVIFWVSPAHSAGMMTHAFTAEEGIEHVKSSALRALLDANVQHILSGAAYPDGGYGSGATELAEHAHWGEFLNDFIEYIRFDANCDVAAADASYTFGDAVDLSAECQQLIAFAMGAKAHGIGDESWDRLFEDDVRRLGENPGNPSDGTVTGSLVAQFGGGIINTIEYSMDMVAIVDHSRQEDTPKALPPTQALIEVYRKADMEYTAADIEAAAAVTRAATQAEVMGSTTEAQRIKMDMPWSSGHYYAYQGGVKYLAAMIGEVYEHIWNKLIEPVESPVAPRIVGTWPRHGEADVRWNFKELNEANGEWGRVYAYFGNAALANSVQPAGTFCIFDEAGNRVPGDSHTGPYGPGSNIAHTLFFRPTENFKPNTKYYVVLTAGIRDRRGASPLRNFSWSFTTGDEQAPVLGM